MMNGYVCAVGARISNLYRIMLSINHSLERTKQATALQFAEIAIHGRMAAEMVANGLSITERNICCSKLNRRGGIVSRRG